MPASGLPFDDIRELVGAMPGPDEASLAALRNRRAARGVAMAGLGRLDEIAQWMAAWQAKPEPTMARPLVCLFAASHGIAAHAFAAPPPPGRAIMEHVAAGGAAVNQICAAFDLGLKVFDLALDQPTPDIAGDAAMSEAACAATMAFGMEAVAGGSDLICLGEVGAGARLVAAALCAASFGGPAEGWIEDGEATRRAAQAARVAAALERHAGALGDPLEALRRVGGRDVAAMAGAILAARHQRIPVLLDGYAATAAAAVLHALDPAALDHCRAAQRAPGAAHGAALARLGLRPLLDLDIAAGEGVGAALAAGVVRAALGCERGIAPLAANAP